MTEKPTALERAFILAKSGRMNAISDIRRQLLAERYDAGQIQGPHLLKQLRGLIEAARTGQSEPEPPASAPTRHRAAARRRH